MRIAGARSAVAHRYRMYDKLRNGGFNPFVCFSMDGSPMVRSNKFQLVVAAIIACGIWLCSSWLAPAAIALTPIRLFDLGYQECPAELAEGAITSGGTSMAAHCYIVTGKAENKSGKPVTNADIFGRIYDANDEPVMQNRTRLGSIEEVPPGISDFTLRISVPANQPTPLKLEQFKASGFTGTVRR